MSNIMPSFAVLVVDDEPDVIKITEMALKNMRLYGAKIKLVSCSSKQEAIAYLTGPDKDMLLTVALIDVVMETDTAGLELCKYIRSELKNFSTPLYIRTGQAGKAPEKKVLEEYNITGYLNKTELTGEKLFSIVYGAVKSFRDRQSIVISSLFLTQFIELLIVKKLDTVSAQKAVLERLFGSVKPENMGIFSGVAAYYKNKLIYSVGTIKDKENLLSELAQAPVICQSKYPNTLAKNLNDELLMFQCGDVCIIFANSIHYPEDSILAFLENVIYPMNTLLLYFDNKEIK